MMSRYFMIMIGAVVLAGFLGCTSAPPQNKVSLVDENWGRSFEAAKDNQIANPEAGETAGHVEGLDGRAAERNVNQYRGSFSGAPQEQVYNLNLGNISGIGTE